MLSEVLLFLCQSLTLCGDIQLMLAQNANNRAAYLEEYNFQTKEDQDILHSLHRESSCQGNYDCNLCATICQTALQIKIVNKRTTVYFFQQQYIALGIILAVKYLGPVK